MRAANRIMLWLLVVAAMGFAGGPSFSDDVTEQALALERRVLEYVKAIHSGEATLTVDVSSDDTRTWKLWFDGDRLRMELLSSQYDRPKTIIQAEGKIFHRGIGIKSDTGEEVLGNAEIHKGDWKSSLFDLRKISVIAAPPGVLHSIGTWEHPLADTMRTREGIVQEIVDGIELVRIDMRAPDGDRTSIWIDEDRGPCLVRYRHTASVKGQTLVDVHINELEQFDGIWFPRKVTHQRFVNHWPGPMQAVTLSRVRFNHAIDNSLFSFSSVGVKPGDHVNVYLAGENVDRMLWDGEQLQSLLVEQQFRPDGIGRTQGRMSSFRGWFAALNGVAAVSCLMLWIIRRRHAATRSNSASPER